MFSGAGARNIWTNWKSKKLLILSSITWVSANEAGFLVESMGQFGKAIYNGPVIWNCGKFAFEKWSDSGPGFLFQCEMHLADGGCEPFVIGSTQVLVEVGECDYVVPVVWGHIFIHPGDKNDGSDGIFTLLSIKFWNLDEFMLEHDIGVVQNLLGQ